MIRFNDRVLIMLPKPESYYGTSENYKYMFKKAMRKFFTFLTDNSVKPCCFCTDELALGLFTQDIKDWIQPVDSADMFFINHNCDLPAQVTPSIQYPEVYKETNTKIKLERGLSKEDRFGVILKRLNRNQREIIKREKVIATVFQKNNAPIKLPAVVAGQFRMDVQMGNLALRCYVGELEITAVDLLDVPFASKSLYDWEVVV